MSDIEQNLIEVKSKIDNLSSEVKLMAVSKHHPIESIQCAIDAGQSVFGENKVQEGIEKVAHFPCHIEWHLIGKLQRNKVRKAVENFDFIHSVSLLMI